VLQRYLAQAWLASWIQSCCAPGRPTRQWRRRPLRVPGLPRPLLIDRQDLKQVVHKLLRALDLHGECSAPLSSAGTVEMRSLLSGPDLASEDIFTFHAEHEERVRQMTADQTSMLAFLRNSIASPSSGERAVARRGWRWNRRVARPRPGSRSRLCATRGAWRASCRGYGTDTRSTG